MTGMPTITTLARPRFLATTSVAACSPAAGWPVTSAVPAPSYPSNVARRDLGRAVHHNSIVRTDAVSPVQAGRGGFGAKQAAPPRGVPR